MRGRDIGLATEISLRYSLLTISRVSFSFPKKQKDIVTLVVDRNNRLSVLDLSLMGVRARVLVVTINIHVLAGMWKRHML